MNNEERIKKAKEAFKQKYAGQYPEKMGITAAYQRAHLYTPGGNNEDIRQEWESELIEISETYRTKQTEETFMKDVNKLATHMNDRFPGRFQNGKVKDGYDEVFRTAHAQKSLSVCLKHRWIQEPDFAIPPVCPVDGIMLKYVGCRDAWTKVNSLDDITDDNGKVQRGYRSHLEMMKAKAKEEGFKTMSEWEVVVWHERTTQKSSENTSSNNRLQTEDGINDKSIDLTIKANPTIHLHLFIGKNGYKGTHKKGNELPYYCRLEIKDDNGDLYDALGPDFINSLSQVLDYLPKRSKRYIYSTKDTTLEEAEATYNGALEILKLNGAF